MTFGCVVLTAGRRPDDLRKAVSSLLHQRGVATDIVVVGTGCDPEGVPGGVRVLALERDDGIPAGRNAGVDQTTPAGWRDAPVTAANGAR